MSNSRKRYFQWLDGEQKGEVVILESISTFDGETFYNFDDGDSCNLRFISKMTSNVVDLKGKFMVEVENPHNIWTFETIETHIPFNIRGADQGDAIPTLHDLTHSNAGNGVSSANITDSNLGKDKLIPPKRYQNLCPLPDPKDYEEKPITKETESRVQIQQKVEFIEHVADETTEYGRATPTEDAKPEEPHKEKESSDPIAILVDSCKKHSTEIPITLKIDLPVKSLYDIAQNEFENGGEKFIDYIVKGIDPKTVIDAIKVSLMTGYGRRDEISSDEVNRNE